MDKIIPITAHPAARVLTVSQTAHDRPSEDTVTPIDRIHPVSAPPAPNHQTKQKIPLEKIQEAVSKVSEFIKSNAKHDSLSFHINTSGKGTTITVMEKETQKIVRTIPSKEMVAMAHAVQNIAGLLHHSIG